MSDVTRVFSQLFSSIFTGVAELMEKLGTHLNLFLDPFKLTCYVMSWKRTICQCCHQKLCHISLDWQHLWWIHWLYNWIPLKQGKTFAVYFNFNMIISMSFLLSEQHMLHLLPAQCAFWFLETQVSWNRLMCSSTICHKINIKSLLWNEVVQ